MISATDTKAAAQAERHRERMALRSRKHFASVADVGEIPAVVNPRRRQACRKNLLKFLTTYFPDTTGLSPFSDDHRRVIARIESCVLVGGRFVQAVYRGFAKTTISENAALWATLYGHRQFVPIFGADKTAAKQNLDSIKLELEENDLLFEDFPEVCHPVRMLEGKPQRCGSQTHHGTLTRIEWTAEFIVLPAVMVPAGWGERKRTAKTMFEASPASGAIIKPKGITAASRGMKFKRSDGTQQRPDFVVIDDPQTDESARSDIQVGARLGLIKKNILRQGGHRSGIAVVVNATVIEPNDVVSQLLDHKKYPAFQGDRIAMVQRFPDCHDPRDAAGERLPSLWLDDYAEIRNTYNPDIPGDQLRAHREATEFYRNHRKEMDRGAVVSWESCFDPDTEISSLQHAYNILIDDGEEVFASECQNAPLEPVEEKELLSVDEIAAKINGHHQGVVPADGERLTMFVDVHGQVHYFAVVAWSAGFDGYVIDYGTFPDQGRQKFYLSNCRQTLSKEFRGSGEAGRIYQGLEALVNDYASREFRRDDGALMSIEKILIDANWGQHTTTVKKFCRATPYRSIVTPSHGQFIGGSTKPMNDHKPQPGERTGNNWRMPRAIARSVRHVAFDTNYWKSFVHSRWSTPPGDHGSLSLWGDSVTRHLMLAEHQRAEFRVKVKGRGREVDEWKQRPGVDNHLFDCLVGCAVGASMLGVELIKTPVAQVKRRGRRTLAEWMDERRQ